MPLIKQEFILPEGELGVLTTNEQTLELIDQLDLTVVEQD